MSVVKSNKKHVRGHVVNKKDGAIKPRGDLNSKTLPDKYGVPNLLDFTNQLHGTSIFSTLDIDKALSSCISSRRRCTEVSCNYSIWNINFLEYLLVSIMLHRHSND